MNEQIRKVTYYIETHLDDELDVLVLAKVAGYSHFHFCRVFKVHMGESVMSYATRLRLERAAGQVSVGKKSMINIALDAGFQTPTGFLKAFKRRFGTTPTDYKSSGSVLRNNYKDNKMNEVTVVDRKEAYVVFTRELGDYEKSSTVAWARLTEKMEGLGKVFASNPPSIEMNLGQVNSEALGICHDDPDITDTSKLRYDAALSWGKVEVSELAKYDFETKSVAGGKYAMVEYKGGNEVAEKAWYGLYAWIEQNGYAYRDEPPFEKYIDAWEEQDSTKIQTEIYVPIVQGK